MKFWGFGGGWRNHRLPCTQECFTKHLRTAYVYRFTRPIFLLRHHVTTYVTNTTTVRFFIQKAKPHNYVVRFYNVSSPYLIAMKSKALAKSVIPRKSNSKSNPLFPVYLSLRIPKINVTTVNNNKNSKTVTCMLTSIN